MKHEYLTLNGKVVYEKIGEGSSAKIMIFSYDEMGRPFAVKYSKNNGTKFTNYFYALNQQGDVVKIFRPVAVTDANGNTTGYTEKTYATYTYDAWGKLIGITNSAGTSIINKQTTSTSLANLNPLRYRGYYYDNETGFYYLQSRYYDPAVKRFINADSATATNVFDAIAYNMFAYCGNNPVVRTDASGNSWFSSLITAVAVVVVATVVAATVIASAGLVACAAVGVATSVGLSAGATAAVSTAATVGCYVVGGGIAACGLNDGMEIATGENYIRDKLLGGSQEAYDRVRTALSIATLAIGSLAEQAQAAGISCFIAGTSVVTADGQKPIEDIQVGDYVWAWDEETDDVALKQVVETYINETTELTHVFVNGEEIIATPTHPFYCPTKGWTDAAHLRAGDILVLVNGEYVVVEKVQHELLESPVKVYNFQVEDYHTYYVASGVLVHNSCRPKSPTKLDKSQLKSIDVHAFKEDNVIGSVAHWDIYKDTTDTAIWLGDKAQKTWIATGFYLHQLTEFYKK